MPSSPINIAGRQPSLMQVLSTVPGPRCARGMRHRLEVILAVAVGAVLSGARSLLAIRQRRLPCLCPNPCRFPSFLLPSHSHRSPLPAFQAAAAAVCSSPNQ